MKPLRRTREPLDAAQSASEGLRPEIMTYSSCTGWRYFWKARRQSPDKRNSLSQEQPVPAQWAADEESSVKLCCTAKHFFESCNHFMSPIYNVF